ncbi:hypothetical protein TWF281_006630 [Arthrobotrys megalospora]
MTSSRSTSLEDLNLPLQGLTMMPLYVKPSIYPGNEASLTGILVAKSVLEMRFISRVIHTGAIRSKGGTYLPLELWLDILDQLMLLANPDKSKWSFMICKKIDIKKTRSGDKRTTLTCHTATPKSGWNFSKFEFESREKVYEAQSWLDSPLKHKDAWRIDEGAGYKIELDEPDNGCYIPSCVYERPLVRDIIARMEAGLCVSCDNVRVLYSGCLGGAQMLVKRFDAFLGDGKDLVCPLCVGIDNMYEDKAWYR